MSLELQPHGFCPVVIGENSRTLPQLPTEGVKRVPHLRIARFASSREFLEIPARQTLDAVILTANRNNDPLGAKLRCASFMKIEIGILNSPLKGQLSILFARLVIRRLAQLKGRSERHISLASMPRLRLRASGIIAACPVCKKTGPPPVSCSEDEP